MTAPFTPIARDAYSYRDDPAVPPFPDDRPLIIFDGYCVLCSRWAQFVLRHDRKARYRLLAAQSTLGQALYTHYGLNPIQYETNILIEDGRAWLKSEGTLRMVQGLGAPWSFIVVLRILPRAVLDRLYELMARNRLKWFGTRATCYMPDPRYADRFL
jgi:predicted DCC family thiol-disulfide oxidoreductase YuxK